MNCQSANGSYDKYGDDNILKICYLVPTIKSGQSMKI